MFDDFISLFMTRYEWSLAQHECTDVYTHASAASARVETPTPANDNDAVAAAAAAAAADAGRRQPPRPYHVCVCVCVCAPRTLLVTAFRVRGALICVVHRVPRRTRRVHAQTAISMQYNWIK